MLILIWCSWICMSSLSLCRLFPGWPHLRFWQRLWLLRLKIVEVIWILEGVWVAIVKRGEVLITRSHIKPLIVKYIDWYCPGPSFSPLFIANPEN